MAMPDKLSPQLESKIASGEMRSSREILQQLPAPTTRKCPFTATMDGHRENSLSLSLSPDIPLERRLSYNRDKRYQSDFY